MSRRWKSSKTTPLRRGWYEIRRTSDGTTDWRAWGRGMWWKQVENKWWLGYVTEPGFQWRGPCRNIKLDYEEVAGGKKAG